MTPNSEADLDLTKKVDAFFARKTILYLQEERSFGWGLKAGENLDENQVFCKFTGKLDSRSPNSIFKMGCVEPKKYGNEASKANDAFPNAAAKSLEYTPFF